MIWPAITALPAGTGGAEAMSSRARAFFALGEPQIPDHVVHQSRVLRVRHPRHLVMIAGLEEELLLTAKARVNVDTEIVEVPEGRHGAQLAVGEEVPHLVFRIERELSRPHQLLEGAHIQPA